MSTNYLAPTAAELEREWGLTIADDWQTDIGPGDYAPIIRRYGVGAAAQREAVVARFGLLAASAKTMRPALSTVNARTETAALRSSFKGAWAARQW
jgi:putative SOS response-associated peptidase YedK